MVSTICRKTSNRPLLSLWTGRIDNSLVQFQVIDNMIELYRRFYENITWGTELQWKFLKKLSLADLLRLSGGTNGKEPTCQCRRHKETWVGSPAWEDDLEKNGNPLQNSCLWNPMDRGTWRATVHRLQRFGHDWSNLACSRLIKDFPGGSDGKVSAYNAGDLGSILGLGRSPGEGNGNPLQYSCLENAMDKGAW